MPRQLAQVAQSFLAHQSVERDELLALHRYELVQADYLTDEEFTRLETLLGVNTKNTVLYGLKKVLPQH